MDTNILLFINVVIRRAPRRQVIIIYKYRDILKRINIETLKVKF